VESFFVRDESGLWVFILRLVVFFFRRLSFNVNVF
jgi:hypothetical protein